MVLNRREIRLSRRVRGGSLHAVRVRVAFSDTLSAANFFFQVTCHREVQAGLHHLYSSSYSKNSSHEYRFNCVVIYNGWRFAEVSF
jgi:hypothetical protein